MGEVVDLSLEHERRALIQRLAAQIVGEVVQDGELDVSQLWVQRRICEVVARRSSATRCSWMGPRERLSRAGAGPWSVSDGLASVSTV